VLFFATYLHVKAPHLSWVSLVLLMPWLGAALVARREYVSTLRDSVYQHRLDTERVSAPVLDRSTTEIFAAGLTATDPKEILYALELFDVEHQKEAHPVIRDLLNHPAPEVRQKAIEMLAKTADKAVLPRVQELLHDSHLGVRTEALLYLAHLSHIDPLDHILQQLDDFPAFSIRSAVAAFLSRPGPSQSLEAADNILNSMIDDTGPEGKGSREEAARLLAVFPDCFDAQLEKLLGDPEPEVVFHAIRAVGEHRKRRFVHELLLRLPDPKLRNAAVEALAQFGDVIVGTLRDHLSDPAEAMVLRREIPAVLLRIGTASAQRALMENVLEADSTFRFRIISALNKLQQTPSAIPIDFELVDTALQAEIMGHYRSYQILGMLQDTPDQDDPIMRGLRESMNQEVERIFRLTSLMHPHLDLHSAYVGLQSKDRIVHDNALEFLDNILKQEMRTLLVPLIDGEVTLAERIRLANHLLHTDVASKENAVEVLINSDDPWLRACGAYAIGTLGLAHLQPELEKCLQHPDPLLRETARQAQLRLAARA
jgi:ATP:ADP antiporter, AAA family